MFPATVTTYTILVPIVQLLLTFKGLSFLAGPGPILGVKNPDTFRAHTPVLTRLDHPDQLPRGLESTRSSSDGPILGPLLLKLPLPDDRSAYMGICLLQS